jgi:hypothetical protein
MRKPSIQLVSLYHRLLLRSNLHTVASCFCSALMRSNVALTSVCAAVLYGVAGFKMCPSGYFFECSSFICASLVLGGVHTRLGFESTANCKAAVVAVVLVVT